MAPTLKYSKYGTFTLWHLSGMSSIVINSVHPSLSFNVVEVGMYLLSKKSTQLPYSVTSRVTGQRRSPKFKDRGCDNVLPGKDSQTHEGMMIDGAMVE
jgi:hypothetical protein